MRLKIFKWIEKTFGILYSGSGLSFNELVTERLENGRLFRFSEITFQIKIKDASKTWIDISLHEEWRKRIKEIASPGSEDTFTFHISKSEDHVTPSDIDIFKGSKSDGLITKYSLTLSVVILKKKEILK